MNGRAGSAYASGLIGPHEQAAIAQIFSAARDGLSGALVSMAAKAPGRLLA